MGTLSLVLLSGVVVLALGSAQPRAFPEEEDMDLECESGQYTRSGECCIQCPPGEGVVRPCGVSQTVCGQCLDSESFSETYSHTERCKTCTECTGLMRMQTPCTDSNDAVCVCNYGFFLDSLSGRCEPCTLCPRGEGVFMGCAHDMDTMCEPCLDHSYSEHDSSLDPCLPCTMCEDTEIQKRNCTPELDAICHDPNMPTFTPSPLYPTTDVSTQYDDSLSSSPAGDPTTHPSNPRFIGPGFNENLIPIYCSILAAVVVGVVAYFIFKRWNSCKQNKQQAAANNRAAAAATAANQTPSPEGEKLHSDSGISVDSQSLQEQQQQQGQTQTPGQALAQSQSQTQLQKHAPEHIVVRMDGAVQPDSPPPQA
ncbi:tumor necrosis factor receptor superfamily member 16 [Engraulis encrasicolus]|uniref:tumor necrosis factor receptor superfamily member 16 n=1 Tax=Engraulis encrasicolus TaxID=184585 RepID=UPI002FD13A87